MLGVQRWFRPAWAGAVVYARSFPSACSEVSSALMMPSSRNRRVSRNRSIDRTFPNRPDAAGFVAEATSVIEPLEGRVMMAITPVDGAITAALAASPHAVTVGVVPWRTPPIGVSAPVGGANIAAGK